MNTEGGRRNSGAGGDEVEQLLQAAQDELLLKLSVDSHMSRVSPDYLLPDLDRRFQALKYRPTATPSPTKPPNQSSSTPNPQQQPPPTDDDKDLFARFAALKASSSSSNTTTTAAVCDRDGGGDSDNDEEDEVEKIIRWAKDAARLDPSPPSDDSDITDGEDDDLNNVSKRKQ